MLLAGLSTPLVLSVHTIVSFDFAMSVLPGWHTTIFPPYFVAGAVFSGFAMVVTWMIPARQFLGLKHVVTPKHLEMMGKIMLATGMMVDLRLRDGALHRVVQRRPLRVLRTFFLPFASTAHGAVYWMMIFCNCVVPQIFWSRRLPHQHAGGLVRCRS